MKSKTNFKQVLNDFTRFKYPYKKTLFSLSKIVSSISVVKNFVNHLDSLFTVLESGLFEDVANDKKRLSEDKIIAKYQNIFCKLEILKKSIENSKNQLNDYKTLNTSNPSTAFQAILLSINKPLMGIANIKWLNNDEFDIVKNLKLDKIIIINTKSFSDDTLAFFTKSLFLELSKQTVEVIQKQYQYF